MQMDNEVSVHEEIEEIGEDESSQDGQQHLDDINVHLEDSYELASPNSSQGQVARSKYYKQTYRPAWEQMPDFKGWLRGVVGEPTRAYCHYCQKTLHAHRLSLLKHTCTIRHQKAAQIYKNKQTRGEMLPILGGVGLDDSEMNQEDVDKHDETDPIEYAEVYSELEEEELGKEQDENDALEDDEEEQEIQLELQQHENNYQRTDTKAPISTHVLDTTKGCPAVGLQVSLYKLIDGRWTYINEGLTNANGRVQNFFERSEFSTGRYKLHYDVDRYFDARKQDSIYPFIEIVFDCRNIGDSYHVPIVLSPFGYSTFKGAM